MENRNAFDNVNIEDYDLLRPNYMPGIFKSIIDFAKLDHSRYALEIGIGTGKATRPILKTGCKLTAVEPAQQLAEFTRKKFSGFHNLCIDVTTFEEYQGKKESFDLVYSASAFHWIDEDLGYKKVMELLKPGGTIALFWSHSYFDESNPELNEEIQKSYRKNVYMDSPPEEIAERDYVRNIKKIENYGFKGCSAKVFRQQRKYDVEEYVRLLDTYSSLWNTPLDDLRLLKEGIADAINMFGGEVTIYNVTDLYLAKKPE